MTLKWFRKAQHTRCTYTCERSTLVTSAVVSEGRQHDVAEPNISRWVDISEAVEKPLCTDLEKGLCCPSSPEHLFQLMREEAATDSAEEPALASFLYSTILAHASLPAALSFLLGNKLGNSALLDTQLMALFQQAFASDPEASTKIAADVMAVYERDPACDKFSQPMLYFKGFQALQAHRVAHWLWTQERKSLALALQSRVSEVFHVDIHPAAVIGSGLLMDHATGIVIGETAKVGDNVSILHHVTLGGTGASGGDRHPKVLSLLKWNGLPAH